MTAIGNERALIAWLTRRRRVAIGFSGGVDSSYLAAVMVEVLGRDHALALVGRYLQDFAYLENGIDMTIAAFLELAPPQQFILSPNIPFYSKIYILTTLVNSAFGNGREATTTGLDINSIDRITVNIRNIP